MDLWTRCQDCGARRQSTVQGFRGGDPEFYPCADCQGEHDVDWEAQVEGTQDA